MKGSLGCSGDPACWWCLGSLCACSCHRTNVGLYLAAAALRWVLS